MTRAKAPKGGNVKAPKGAGGIKSSQRRASQANKPIPLDDPRLQAFIAAVADGMQQATAYDAAFGTGANGKPRKPESTQQLASRLAARPDVKAAIAELQKSRYIGNLWDAIKSAEAKLTALAMAEGNGDPGGMVKAAESLDKQFGVGAPMKIDLTNSDGSLMPSRIVLVAAGDDA